MTNNQDTITKQVPNSKIQNPKLVIRIWSLVIIWLLVIVSWLLPFPVSALDNPEQEIADVIEDYVLTKYPEWIGLGIQVSYKYVDNIFEELRALEGYVDFEIVEVYEDFKPVGNVIFPIKVTSDEISKKIFVRAKVEVFNRVAVAKKSIKRGEVITSEDLALEERDIAMLPERYYERLDQVINMEAKTSIPKNSTIFEWMIKEVPLVHRGDVVAILVTAPSLLVKTTGVALEDGYLGKEIKVKSNQSKKTIAGVLISTDEVEVKLK